VANRIVKKADAVTVENLQVKNMMKRCKPVKSDTGRFLSNGQSAKRGLNRSIADASWYCLTQKVECLGAKLGKSLYRVNPKYTSQNCSKCRNVDKNSRNGEKFICTNFGHTDDANLEAARSVRHRSVFTYHRSGWNGRLRDFNAPGLTIGYSVRRALSPAFSGNLPCKRY
jgi:putative transposase